MDGLLALDLWDVVSEVLRSYNTKTPSHQYLATDARRELFRKTHPNPNSNWGVTFNKQHCKTRTTCPRKQETIPSIKPWPKHQLKRANETLINCRIWTRFRRTHILLKVSLSCAFFEDNEVVIKMIIKGRSPTMRHVSRTHRVALDWLFDRITLDPKIQIKMLTPQTNLLTCWPMEASRVMSGTIFLACWISWSFRHSLAASSFSQTESSVPCQKRSQKSTSTEGSPMQHRDRWIWCLTACWVRGRILHKVWVIPKSGGIPKRSTAMFQPAFGNQCETWANI